MAFLVLYIITLIGTSVHSLDPYVIIPRSSTTLDATRGSTFEIRCDAVNRPGAISTRWERDSMNCSKNVKPPCRIQLSQDRMPDDQQKYGLKFEASDTYILIIKNIDVSDEGLYFCQLQLTRYVKVFDQVYIRVVESPSIDPMKTSSDQFVESGSDVTLQCGAFGIPKPLIKWTRAGNGVMPGGGFVKLGETLNINQIQPQFRGPYICSAENDIAEAHRTINVDMNFPPDITSDSTVIYQKAGYEARLSCRVDAYPAAEVSWNVDGKSLSDDRYSQRTYEAAFKKVISRLTIKKVTSSDFSSTYMCVAKNNIGPVTNTRQLTFSIRESDQPMPVAGEIRSSGCLVRAALSLVLISIFINVF